MFLHSTQESLFVPLPLFNSCQIFITELFERNTSESTAHVIESVVNEDFVIYEATAISEESEVRTPDEGNYKIHLKDISVHLIETINGIYFT